MRYRVFVSHVNEDDDSNALLDALCPRLESAEMDVLLDRTCLGPGVLWRQEIYGWLGLCHAAVILISRPALDDPAKIWVARETSILAWRQALDPALKVIPVALSGIDPAELAQGRFSDLLLREIQCLRAAPDPEETAARIVEALAKAVGAPKATPLDATASQIAARLRGLDKRALAEAAALIGADLGEWRPATDAATDVALALLCVPLEQAASALEYLAGFANRAARADLQDVAQVLAANWVDPEAARWLAHHALAGHASVLNAWSQFAAEAYVQRACGQPPPGRWPLVPLTGVTGESAAEDIKAEVEAALARSIPLRPDSLGPSPTIRRQRVLEQRRKEGRPVFLLARLPVEPHALLRGLRTACPAASPFFLAGDLTESQADQLGEPFRILRPLLEPDEDSAAQTCLDDLLSRLGS